MGISSSTTKVEPWKQAQQPILNASSTLANTYQNNAGKIQGYADQIGNLMPTLLGKYNAGDAGVNAARGWITNTLGRTGSNPYIDQMVNQTGLDTANTINASLGTRGNVGGSVQQHILANELAKQELGLRYNDYNNQQQLQANAAGLAPGLAAADTIQIQPLLAAANSASGLPMDAASQYAGGIGGLLGQYNTTKSSTPWGPALLGAAASAAGAYFGGKSSDIRLKEDIRHVGQTNAGLPIYTYRYKGDPMVHMGVMAQDVAQSQPEALGPLINGEYMTVKYGEVR